MSSLEEEGISVIVRDITREKEIDQMKSEFVSNVSHELRTPLTSVKGAAELLLMGAEGPLTDSQREHGIHLVAQGLTTMAEVIRVLPVEL